MENNTKVFFKGVSVQTIITMVMGVLEVVVFSIMSRLLSKADFGYFAAMTGIIMIFQSLSEAGLGSAIIQKKEANSSYISTAFTLSLSLGVIGMLLVMCFAPLLADLVADDTLTTPLRLMSFTILLNSLMSVGNAQLYRSLNFKRVGIIQCNAYIISSIIGIILAWMGWGVMAIVTYTILNSLLITLIIFMSYVKVPKLILNKADARSIVSFGGWLTLGVILNNITQQIDKLFMSKWLSVEALGSYNRPAGFANTISTKVNGIFDTVLFPMLSNIQDKKDLIVGTFYRAVGLLNSFSVVLAAIFFFNAELIIQVFFGIQWLELAPIMRIVSISIVFNINGRLVDCFFRSLNFVRTGFYLRLLGVFVTFFCLFLGAKHGVKGVAIGLVIANVTMIIIKMLVLCSKIGGNFKMMFKNWTVAWKPVLVFVIIGVLHMKLPYHELRYNIIFACLYGLCIIIEFIYVPTMVGKEYKEIVYPVVKKYKEKIMHK